MRQIMYTSRSLIGLDESALDLLLEQASVNNLLLGATGLLWTDGDRFAQVIEGEDRAVVPLLASILLDPRHTDCRVTRNLIVDQRAYGGWSMARPAANGAQRVYEERALRSIDTLLEPGGDEFAAVVRGAVAAGA